MCSEGNKTFWKDPPCRKTSQLSDQFTPYSRNSKFHGCVFPSIPSWKRTAIWVSVKLILFLLLIGFYSWKTNSYFTFWCSLTMLTSKMRCPGLALVPNWHGKICFVSFIYFSRCCHRELLCSCLDELSTYVAECIWRMIAASWCHFTSCDVSSQAAKAELIGGLQAPTFILSSSTLKYSQSFWNILQPTLEFSESF